MQPVSRSVKPRVKVPPPKSLQIPSVDNEDSVVIVQDEDNNDGGDGSEPEDEPHIPAATDQQMTTAVQSNIMVCVFRIY